MKTFLREALFMENKETKPNFARLAEKYDCDYRTIKRYYENRDAYLMFEKNVKSRF